MKVSVKDKDPISFVTVNPMVYEYSKRYIWGTTQDSLRLFFRLCNMHIYIDGFADDELSGGTIYHKKIYEVKECMAEGCIFLVSDPVGNYPVEAMFCDNPIIINPEVIYSDIYIYGAGYIGEKVLKYLNGQDIKIKGFIDSDFTKVNKTVLGVKIYEKKILKSLKARTSIIEAGKCYKEIDAIVRNENEEVNRYYCIDEMWRDDAIYIDGNKFDGIIFTDDIKDKKIFLCGKDYDLIYRYFELFKILDFKNICIAKWAEDCCGDEFCCIEDVVLESDGMIIFCEEIGVDDLKKIHSMGLERGKDFCDIRCNIWEKYHGVQMLDTNLAFTRNMPGGNIPGIAVFGDNCEDDYKIAVLGASNSTSGYYYFKSWPELLYEEYAGKKVTIFNGAVESYTSAQELVKLMRDIVWLKPNLVIVYDGHSDVVRDDQKNIFEIPYMKTIMEYAVGKVMGEVKTDKYDIFCGVSSSQNTIDVWLKNIEYMHAICQINNIKFLSFMQPMFFSKPQINSKREKIISKKWLFYFLNNIDIVKVQKSFRERAEEISRSHDYIFDLTYVLDDEDVYMDFSHLFEEGNRIIAHEIYEVIKGVI